MRSGFLGIISGTKYCTSDSDIGTAYLDLQKEMAQVECSNSPTTKDVTHYDAEVSGKVYLA